ncbi:HIT family protein [Flavihumibacter sp. UBA7668]|uniref:HIT family protein n=1 Tax=Flavihumibacter sp. UBA7668 TaxID=1946542 RepID=UPI0025C5225A|nr:HIT family protein [Flavihumibacter sp. UBA7668]
MTIFTKLINGEIPSYKIAENDKFYAFLDVFPMVPGHVLVVPKMEVDKFYEVPDAYLAEILVFAKPIARAIEQAFPCQRVGSAVIGLEVPHAHLHLVPLQSADDLNFTRPKLKQYAEELKTAQEKILAHLEKSEVFRPVS